MHRVFWLMYSNKLADNWWKWLWEQHHDAEVFLQQNWKFLEPLAAKLATACPYAASKKYHPTMPVLIATGPHLTDWCREVGCPIRDRNIQSKPY